jgi:hypothetical protein
MRTTFVCPFSGFSENISFENKSHVKISWGANLDQPKKISGLYNETLKSKERIYAIYERQKEVEEMNKKDTNYILDLLEGRKV